MLALATLHNFQHRPHWRRRWVQASHGISKQAACLIPETCLLPLTAWSISIPAVTLQHIYISVPNGYSTSILIACMCLCCTDDEFWETHPWHLSVLAGQQAQGTGRQRGLLSSGGDRVALRDIAIDKQTLAPPKYLLSASSTAAAAQQQPTAVKPADSVSVGEAAGQSAGKTGMRKRRSCSLMMDHAACLAYVKQVSPDEPSENKGRTDHTLHVSVRVLILHDRRNPSPQNLTLEAMCPVPEVATPATVNTTSASACAPPAGPVPSAPCHRRGRALTVLEGETTHLTYPPVTSTRLQKRTSIGHFQVCGSWPPVIASISAAAEGTLGSDSDCLITGK